MTFISLCWYRFRRSNGLLLDLFIRLNEFLPITFSSDSIFNIQSNLANILPLILSNSLASSSLNTSLETIGLITAWSLEILARLRKYSQCPVTIQLTLAMDICLSPAVSPIALLYTLLAAKRAIRFGHFWMCL